MGMVKDHPPVKYFAAITYNQKFNDLERILGLLQEKLSEIELKSDIYDFSDFTNYYEPEMGKDLKKFFVVFSNLCPPEKLSELKNETNQIEAMFMENEKRLVNIDPGYISEAKVVLATTKNYDHRIYLTNGIFADLHLRFNNKSFQTMPWTYPDYQQKNIIDFFVNVRQRYFIQLDEIIKVNFFME